MNATGIERQEQKIVSLARVVTDMAPGLDALPVKGALRLGIDAALKARGLDSWKDMAHKPVAEKRDFFDQLCGHALPRLARIGFPEAKAGELARRLREANERFLG
ncbi:hypothetical protein [Desulfocurvus sp. DL9XJH121]